MAGTRSGTLTNAPRRTAFFQTIALPSPQKFRAPVQNEQAKRLGARGRTNEPVSVHPALRRLVAEFIGSTAARLRAPICAASRTSYYKLIRCINGGRPTLANERRPGAVPTTTQFKLTTLMPKGISLHLGLNFVDPAQYEGWDGELAACEFDAKDMLALAKRRGFARNTILLTAAATSAAVMAGIAAAAKQLKSGDIFFLTYSGHGGQVPDRNGDEKENDRMDETWCLYDRQLVDDELYALWSQFKKGVRLLVLSDSCHSGTVTRAMPPSLSGGPRQRLLPWFPRGKQVYRAHKAEYDAIQASLKGTEKAIVRASVLLVSGCQDNQTSLDGSRNGLFTEKLKKTWNNGKFVGGYRSFRDQVVAKMPANQTPNYYVVGAKNAGFEAQQPFMV